MPDARSRRVLRACPPDRRVESPARSSLLRAFSLRGVDLPTHRYGAALANAIEEKWRERWELEGTYLAPNPAGVLGEANARLASREAFYVLDMFPYPSGSGLHVGHPLGYIGTDVVARFKRM